MTVFADIYREHRWAGSESRSGWASSLEQTTFLRTVLPGLCASLGVESVLDAPCGDSYWQPELPGYVGVDIVPDAVTASRERHPGRRFELADILHDELPAADLVLCRDLFPHLSYEDGWRALANLRRTGARYLLATTSVGATIKDAPTGGIRRVDMEAVFALGRPLALLDNGRREGRDHDRWLGLWAL